MHNFLLAISDANIDHLISSSLAVLLAWIAYKQASLKKDIKEVKDLTDGMKTELVDAVRQVGVSNAAGATAQGVSDTKEATALGLSNTNRATALGISNTDAAFLAGAKSETDKTNG